MRLPAASGPGREEGAGPMTIATLMTPPRCPARAAAAFIPAAARLRAVSAKHAAWRPLITYRPPGWFTSGGRPHIILCTPSGRRPPLTHHAPEDRAAPIPPLL